MKERYWLYLLAIVGVLAALYVYGSDDESESGGDVSSSDVVSTIGDGWARAMGLAMAAAENVNPLYNNPMAVGGTGDTGTSFGAGLGIYSTFDAGLQAGINLLESYARRFPFLTINQAISRWITGKIDATSDAITNYQNSVNNALGTDGDTTTLGDLSGSDDSGDF